MGNHVEIDVVPSGEGGAHDAKIEDRRGREEGGGERCTRGVYRSVLLPDHLGLIAGCSGFGPKKAPEKHLKFRPSTSFSTFC